MIVLLDDPVVVTLGSGAPTSTQGCLLKLDDRAAVAAALPGLAVVRPLPGPPRLPMSMYTY